MQEFADDFMTGEFPFGFIYYAGHGAQVDRDTYIFGTDAENDIDNVVNRYSHSPDANLFRGGIKFRDEILDQIGSPGKGTLFVVLDACRENPLFDNLRARKIPLTGPLGRSIQPFPGLKILYSTSGGAIAGDGAGGNSPFATIFAREMMKTASVDYLIRSVVHDVFFETSDPSSRQTLLTNVIQSPEETGSLQEPPPDVCFSTCP
jgi:uncharacterized caspase-like protein